MLPKPLMVIGEEFASREINAFRTKIVNRLLQSEQIGLIHIVLEHFSVELQFLLDDFMS
jgi:uncharacterized iron-regulated protein